MIRAAIESQMSQNLGLNHKATKPPRALLIALCLCAFVGLFSESLAYGQVRANSNLHQWGAVTLFHGLPSDHVRAIAQGPDGVMWFGTDAGLARYDGRRVQRIAADGPAAARVRALRLDGEGVLWIGGDGGAARWINGEVKPIPETQGRTVTAIITPERGRAVMVTEQGEIFDCSTKADGSIAVRTITARDSQLLAIESRGDRAVQLTSLASAGNRLILGSHSRGLLSVDLDGAEHLPPRVAEILSHPRRFFVETIETDERGHLWFGAQTSSGESGVYDGTDLDRPIKLGVGTGTVTAIKRGERGELWAGTDTSGVFIFRDGRKLEHFTFENTAGGLRSNRINSVCIDREGVVWFGTDRGACRYDPRALTVETISGDPESNFARTLFRSSDGTLWCGTN